jgi:hypothetical protein
MTPTIMSLVLAACSPAQDERPRPTTIPADAPEIDNDVYYLGTQIDPQTGEDIEGLAIVDRLEDFTQADDGGHPEPLARRGCYADLGFGGWTTTEAWGFDGTNSSGLADADIQATLEASLDVWEDGSSTNIFGDYDSSYSGNASTTSDGENNVEFGNAGGGSTVAVTYIWGRSFGAPSSRYISEWDQIYEDDFDWTIGDPVGSGAFDFFNVAAHEVGHAAGLGHPSTAAACAQETMYAYVSTGETKKRDLNTGDLQGIRAVY